MLFTLKSSLVAGKGSLLASCCRGALHGHALPCSWCISPGSTAGPAWALQGDSSGTAPGATPATDPHVPQPGITYHPKGDQSGGNQIPASAARWTQSPGPAACPRSAGCSSGYHCVHPRFLFAPLSIHAGRWLAGKLAQAQPGHPSAPPSPVPLRLHRGPGCTAGTRPAACSLPGTPPMARCPRSRFCVYLFLEAGLPGDTFA